VSTSIRTSMATTSTGGWMKYIPVQIGGRDIKQCRSLSMEQHK